MYILELWALEEEHDGYPHRYRIFEGTIEEDEFHYVFGDTTDADEDTILILPIPDDH